MEEFLRETKHNLKSLDDFQKVRVVIGNEACDLDSAISALVYAYFLFKTNVNPSMAIIPVLNIPREDYGLRTEITFFLAQSDIQADLLIFRDEINLLQIHEDGRLMLTLVDHNVLTNGDEALEHAVVEVIDHHYKERDDDDERCEVTIEMVGSCCTLVAEKLLNKEPDLIDEKIANLLYGTILLDTIGLSMEAGRVTSKDEDVVRQLELSVRYPNPEELFQTLQNVKFDLSGLSLSQLLRKDVKVIQNATMNIAISSVPVLIEEFVKRSNIEKELESLCLKYNYNILVIMGIAVTTDNVTHRQMGIYSKIHGYRDQIIDVLESSDDPNLELELFDIGISTMSAFKQANTVSRKKVLPMLKTFLLGDTTPPEGTGFENTMLLSSESFSKLEITGRDVSEEFDSGDSQLDSREECESPLEFSAQLPDNPDSSSNFLDFSDGGIDNPAFTASVEEPNLECDGSGCPSRDPPNTSPYDPFTTITVNNPDNEPVLLLYDVDSEPPEASNSSSNQDTCPATPASSFVDGNFDEVTEQHLPSFNSREMTDIIETKKAKLGGYELDPSNQTYPFTPKNSFVDSSLETLRGELPDFDSESILQKIHEKKMSFEAFDSEDGDENVFTDPSDSSVDFDMLNLSSKSQPLTYNPKELHSYSKFVHSDESSLTFSRDYKGPGHSIHRDSFGDDLINAEFIKTFSQQISSESENGFGDKFAETFSMQVEIDGMPAEVIQRRQSKDILGDLLRRESKPGVDGITRDCLDPVLSPGSYGGKGDAADSGYIDLSNGESSSEIHKFSPDDMMSTEDVDSEKIFEQGGNSTDDNPGAFSGTEEQAYRTPQGSSADWPTKQTNDDDDDSSYEEEDEKQQASVQDCVDTRTQGITNLAFEDDDESIAGQSGNNLEAQSAIIVGDVLKKSENIVKKSTETSISIGQTCYHPLMSSLDLESHSAAIVQNVLKEGEKILNRTIGQSDKSPDKISSEGTEDDSTSDTLPSEVSPDKGTLGVEAGGWGDMSASVISESQKTEGDPFTSSIEMDSSMEYLGTLHGKKLHGGLMGDNHFYEHSEFDFEIPISRLPSGIGMVSIAESETKADSDELVDSVDTVKKNELPTDKNGNALPDVAKRKFDYKNERDGCVFVEVDTHAMKEIYHTTAGLVSLPLEINEHSRLDDLANDSVLPPKDNPLLPNPYQLDENLLAAADKLIEMTEAAKTSGHGLGLQTRPLRLPHPPSDINELSSYSEFLTCEFDNQSVQYDLTKEPTSLDTNKSLADQSMDEGANYELETIDFPQSPNRLNLRVQLETSQEYNKEEANISYQDENEIPEEIALQAGLSPVTEDGIKTKQGRPTSLSTSCANKKKKKIIVSPDAFKDKEDDHMSLHSNSEVDLASPVDDSGTPDDLETPEDLDDSLLQDDWDDKPKISEKIPELSAEEELEEERSWRTVILAGKQHKIDMKVIEPYKKVLSHGGYYGSGLNAIIVFTACYLPDRGRKDYDYVMDNLFLYVISTLDLLVAEDYILVYLHGATPRRNVPSFGWLKRCYQMIDRRLRKNLKGLYLVHPTFWLKTIVVMTRPFISTKFSSKLRFVSSLKELGELIPLEYVYIPDKIQQYDEQKYGLQ